MGALEKLSPLMCRQSRKTEVMTKQRTNLEPLSQFSVADEAQLLKHFEQVIARGHEDKIVLLPWQIRRVRLQNIGPFGRFEASFRKDQLNLLFGLGGSGKSVILRSIALCFGIRNKYFQMIGREGRLGKIQIEVYPASNCIVMNGKDTNLTTRFANARCVLLDDPFDYLPPIRVRNLVRRLGKIEKQVILASKRSDLKDAVPSKNTIMVRTRSRDTLREPDRE